MLKCIKDARISFKFNVYFSAERPKVVAGDYKLLGHFCGWIAKNTFALETGVAVKIEVSRVESLNDYIPTNLCRACNERFKDAKLPQLVDTVVWKNICTIDLPSIVSCFVFFLQQNHVFVVISF